MLQNEPKRFDVAKREIFEGLEEENIPENIFN
jgi:hypothetical protein